jgi:adenosylcobinamide-phosphate synthase
LTEVLLGWTCLAAKNLEQEADAVLIALQKDDLELARERLSRIVGRDTGGLTEEEISRAVIETVAESASDGVMAPMFYLSLGGVPLAIAYKAVNTLDSMIGHADQRYFYFGKAAARLDDIANFIPSRLSALSIVGAVALVNHANSRPAWQTWLRDGGNHRSPNAGQPESAMAGALGVRLGGDNSYAGEIVSGRHMGSEFPPPTRGSAQQAVRLVGVASLIGLGLGVVMASLWRTRKRD